MDETLMDETLARIMIAGSHSGVGKTTVSSAIIAGLTARGLRVQPFKAGPDYIDPSHLTRAAQVAGQRVAGQDLESHSLEPHSLEPHSLEYHDLECRNLDPYILPIGTLEALFFRAAARADVALIEGVMGLFDGKDADSDAFSSADLANRLQTPVILVLDVGGTARSAAAMALGFQRFAPNLKLAGVILNRVGSSYHAELCEVALAQVGIRSFGFLERRAELELPERNLGLILAGEAKLDLKAFVRAAQTLDLDGILEVARAAGPLEVPANSRPDALSDSGQKMRARIAIARDAAFNFYYADALETLLDCGAQLVPFSPLEDESIPEVDGLFIGGGYPELHAAKLAANTRMLEGVRAFCASGKPVVAECGGLMYLAESLTDLEGRTHAMCAVIPAKSRMLERPVLGYREVIALEDSAIALAGTILRGHEFHYSSLEAPSSQSSQSESRSAYRSAYRKADGTETEGFVIGNILASYIHLHFASDPALAQRFVTNAARFAPPVKP